MGDICDDCSFEDDKILTYQRGMRGQDEAKVVEEVAVEGKSLHQKGWGTCHIPGGYKKSPTNSGNVYTTKREIYVDSGNDFITFL